jgi:hypothetical protein
MARTMLSSMRWRSCRGLIHRLQSGETLSCVGLSKLRELTFKPIAGGVVDTKTCY